MSVLMRRHSPEGEEVVPEEPATEEEVVAEVQEIEIDLEDDVKALLEGEELSAELKKTKTSLQSNQKLNLFKELEIGTKRLTEEVSGIRNELTNVLIPIRVRCKRMDQQECVAGRMNQRGTL